MASWGHDFRPDYLTISRLTERFPDVPRVALTATATTSTAAEIASRLGLRLGRGHKGRFVSSFDRPNIEYRIVAKDDPHRQLLDFLRGGAPGRLRHRLLPDPQAVWRRPARFLTRNGIEAIRTTPACPRRCARRARPGSRRSPRWWWWRPSPSAWGSTSPTSGSWPTSTCRSLSRATTRRPAGRGGTVRPPPPGSPTGPRTSCSCAGSSPAPPGGALRRRVAEANLDSMLALCETMLCRRGSS